MKLPTYESILSVCYQYQLRATTPPTYTKTELIDWAIDQKVFQIIFEEWVAGGYKKMQSPTICKIDTNLALTLNNLQIITKREHISKHASDVKTGKHPGTSKVVEQLNEHSRVIATFHSARQAARANDLPNHAGVVSCCNPNKRNKTTGDNLRFRYKVYPTSQYRDLIND